VNEHPEILRRFVSAEMSGAEGRILEGLCVPYNTPARVQDPGGPPYDEVFAPGSFARALKAPNRVHLRFEHRDGLTDRIGRALELREAAEGLWGSFQVVGGMIGDHALALVDEGMVSGFSVGFVPLGRSRKNEAGQLVRTRCHLADVSLVPEPAYAGTEVVHRARGRDDFQLPPGPLEEQLTRLRTIGIAL
jgi:hypothetical protein